jgi:hypothetical protein
MQAASDMNRDAMPCRVEINVVSREHLMSNIRITRYKRLSVDVICMPGIVHDTLDSVYHLDGVILGTLHRGCHLNRAFSKRKARSSIAVNRATTTTSSRSTDLDVHTVAKQCRSDEEAGTLEVESDSGPLLAQTLFLHACLQFAGVCRRPHRYRRQDSPDEHSLSVMR